MGKTKRLSCNTHNWTVKHVEFNNIFWVQSNFIAINQTDYQMKWTQAIWNDVEMDTPPQNNVSNAQIMLNWSFRRQSTHKFIDRSFLYRTNKPQHCIYIIWIWQFPNQSTINQWFSYKKKNDDNGRMKKTLKFAQQFPLIIWCAILSYYCVKKGLTELLLELI